MFLSFRCIENNKNARRFLEQFDIPFNFTKSPRIPFIHFDYYGMVQEKLSWNGSFRSLSESCIALWSFWKLRKVRALSILLSHAWARWFGTRVTLISLNISMHTDQVVLDVFLLSHFVFLSISYRFMVSEIKNLWRACLMTILPRKLLNYARERWTQIICINYLNYSQ